LDKLNKHFKDLDEKANLMAERIDSIKELQGKEDPGLEESGLMVEKSKKDQAEFERKRAEALKSIERKEEFIKLIRESLSQFE